MRYFRLTKNCPKSTLGSHRNRKIWTWKLTCLLDKWIFVTYQIFRDQDLRMWNFVAEQCFSKVWAFISWKQWALEVRRCSFFCRSRHAKSNFQISRISIKLPERFKVRFKISIFSSPGLKVHVSYSDRLLFVVSLTSSSLESLGQFQW